MSNSKEVLRVFPRVACLRLYNDYLFLNFLQFPFLRNYSLWAPFGVSLRLSEILIWD